ncbi:hypothetical protein B7494_g1472 [Chlorociboria aeruginascens]|nr:hypothetical protein B7494_g1472 [Chlorociboria aeruginascens]
MQTSNLISSVQPVEGPLPNASDKEEFRMLYENIWSPNQLPKPFSEPIIADGGRETTTRRRISPKPRFRSNEICEKHNITSTTDVKSQDSGLPDLGSISTNAAEDSRNTTQKMKTLTRKLPLVRKTALRRAAVRQAMLKEDHSNEEIKKCTFPRITSHRAAWTALLGLLHSKTVRISDPGTTYISRLSRQHGCASDFVRLKFGWKTFSLKTRIEFFPRMMLTALSINLQTSLNLLSLIYSPKLCPKLAIPARILDYIIVLYLHNERPRYQSAAKYIFFTFKSLLRQHPGEKIILSQISIQLLISNLEPRHVYQLYNVLKMQGQTLNGYNLRQFAHAFLAFRWDSTAFAILKRIRAKGYDLNTSSISAICMTLLERRPLDKNVSCEIYGLLFDSGMRPNLAFYNILIKNFIAVGDHEAAWKVHDMILDHGKKPDHFTYSTLLHDANRRMDKPTMKRLITIIQTTDQWDSHLVTDMLHTIFLLCGEKGAEKYAKSLSYQPQTSEVFKQMLPVYCKYFQLEPLAKIIPFFWESYAEYASQANGTSENDNTFPNQSAKKATVDLMVATGRPLVVMLASYLEGHSEPNMWYRHFRGLVRCGDPAVSSLMVEPHIYDITLMAYSKIPSLVSRCPHIIRDMLYPNVHLSYDNRVGMKKSLDISASIVSTNSTTPQPNFFCPDRSHITPKPDGYTWSILVKILMDNKQPHAAEKVITMMRARGMIQQKHPKWGSLATGYARWHKIGIVSRTMLRLKTAGHEVNDTKRAGLRDLSGFNEHKKGTTLNRASQRKSAEKFMENVDDILRMEEQLFQESKHKDLRRPHETVEEFNKHLLQKYPDRLPAEKQVVRRVKGRAGKARRVKVS